MPSSGKLALRPRRLAQKTRAAAFFVIAVTAALATAEIAWRVLMSESVEERHSRERMLTSLRFLEPCAGVETRAGKRFVVGRQPQNTGGGFDVPLEKTPGVHRIAFIGESTGVMLGGTAHNLLQASPEAAAWEILNCAEGGTTLEHVKRRAAEVMAYSPDVIFVVFGHNWMMPVMAMSEVSLRAQWLLSRSRLIAGLANRVALPNAPSAPDPVQRLASLETFLRQVAREGRGNGAVVVLSTLTANLWYPPLIEEASLWNADFLQALVEYAEGNAGAASARLDALIARDDHPYWHFVLGTWLARGGEAARAAEHFQLAVDGEKLEVDRAPSQVNALIRRVAAEEGARLRDTEREMRAVATAGLTGWDVMRDHCHLQPLRMSDEAQVLLDMAAAAVGDSHPPHSRNLFAGDEVVRWMLDGLATVQAQVRGARARRGQRAIAYFIERWARAERERTLAAVSSFLGGAVLAGLEPGDRVAVLVSVADGYEWAGLHADALRVNALARQAAGTFADEGSRAGGVAAASVHPNVLYERAPAATAWIQLGLLRLSSGGVAPAADAFERALQIAPERGDAAFLFQHSARSAAGVHASPD